MTMMSSHPKLTGKEKYMRRKSYQSLPFQCIAYFLCKRRFQNGGSKPSKESLKMGLEDDKGGGVYVYHHGRTMNF